MFEQLTFVPDAFDALIERRVAEAKAEAARAAAAGVAFINRSTGQHLHHIRQENEDFIRLFELTGRFHRGEDRG